MIWKNISQNLYECITFNRKSRVSTLKLLQCFWPAYKQTSIRTFLVLLHQMTFHQLCVPLTVSVVGCLIFSKILKTIQKNFSIIVHWSQKILARSHFFHSIFHRFFQFSQKWLKIIKCFIHHMKDLKSGYLISLKQKAWLSLKGSHALGNETRTFLTKINFLAFWVELLLISNVESICLF